MAYYIKQDLNDTICALATAGGVGAIGVIRVSGKQAIQIVDAVFKGKRLTQQASHTVHFGKIADGPKVIDEVLATLFVEPKSYTGENTVELSCHGSPYIQQQMLQLLVNKGCRLAKPGEFTLRAFLNKKLDLSQAEAVADLIASNSEESHRTAMMQMRGGFSYQIAEMRERLINFASLIELELDFAEEDVEFAQRDELIQLVTTIQALIAELLQSFKYGNAIKNGIPTVIAGKPNAGKSTLLNTLVNEERALVSDIAGTTRDTIEEAFVIDGITFRLIDTAGIRTGAGDKIEEMGIERTFEKIQQASVILYVFDASITTADELQEELTQFNNLNVVLIPVANKTDLQQQPSSFAVPNLVSLSAKEKTGINQLKLRLSEAIRKDEVKNDIIITNLRHYEALQHAHESLDQVLVGVNAHITGELLAFDIRKALFHLGEITGEVTTDDLLANIFSKFCIGK
ncbi:MAG: tRNA uridine-5-carboxymethylaminomethyl(34) synthesis GTPase MnmE [Bacteroidetes bacterium]|nr:MAG: tRNA uridine-5-carboxymethylaminomethyl(34) synthesis GTPase MnmE [Bacteroidota bacterium]